MRISDWSSDVCSSDLLVHPKGQFLITMGGKRVSESVVITVGGFVTLYVLAVCVLTLAMVASGLDFATAFSAVVACINNMGPGIGVVASTFRDVSDPGIWVSSFTMILGRLEILPILVLLSPQFWREWVVSMRAGWGPQSRFEVI